MDRNICISCVACKEECDQCIDNAGCIESLKSHQEIFYLGEQFPSKVIFTEIN